MYNKHFSNQNEFWHNLLFQPSFSYRMLFQRFFPQNISLLPKIVTEAHANLKKKKTNCNTTLKHYAVMIKYTPLECSSQISSLICYLVVFFPFIHHQFIIKVHMGCSALLHSAHFPPALCHLLTKRRLGSCTCASCLSRFSLTCSAFSNLWLFSMSKTKCVYLELNICQCQLV